MDQERIYLLLTRWLSGEATPRERDQLEQLFIAHPELRRTVEALSNIRSTPPKNITTEEEQRMMQKGWEKLLESSSPIVKLPVVRRLSEDDARQISDLPTAPSPGPHATSIPRRAPWKWIAAASAITIVAIGGWLFSKRHTGTTDHVQPVAILVSGRGARKSAKLPDGTKLWLNAGSRIVLAADFSQNKRELTLEGEAYFDVQHDEKNPFIIHTGALEVRVLGTALNVRAYPGDPVIETTLVEGKAEVGLAGNPQSAILLRPNEKVIVANEPGEPYRQQADGANTKSTDSARGEASLPVRYERRPIVPDRTDGTIAETSWTHNKLVFRNEPLGSISARLERWYDVKIIFDNNRYQQDTISGTFPNIPVGDVMHALQLTEKFHYRVASDTIHVW